MTKIDVHFGFPPSRKYGVPVTGSGETTDSLSFLLDRFAEKEESLGRSAARESRKHFLFLFSLRFTKNEMQI